MADTTTLETTAAEGSPQAPGAAAGSAAAPPPSPPGGIPFLNATGKGINIITKNGQEMNKAQATPSPGPENQSSDTSTTNADTSSDKTNANAQNAENQDNAAASGEGAPQNEGEGGETAAAAASPDLLSLLKDRSGGTIEKPEDALALVDEVTTLRTQLAERPQIEFPNDQAKQIYEFAQKYPGLEMSAAKNFLHIQSLPIDKLEPKELQFEAFALKKPQWTREKARQYFDEKYDKLYAPEVLEASAVAQGDHEDATNEARAELAKFQQQFAAAKPSQQAGEQQTPQLTPEQRTELQRRAEEVTKNFGGVRYQFVKDDPNSTVSVPMDKSALQKFQTYLADPGEFLNDLYAECTVNNVFDQVKFRDAMFEFMNRKKVHEVIYQQGRTHGKLEIINERKNTSTQKPNTDNGAPAKPATMQDAWRAAAGKQKV